jgi:hypothetical protein
MSDPNILPAIFNTYKSFSDCSTDEVAEGLCPWIENPYKREDICNYLIHRAITVRFPNLCPFTSGPGAELFEPMLLLVLLFLFLIICCVRDADYIHNSKEGDEAEWEREHDADDCEYESKKRKRE